MLRSTLPLNAVKGIIGGTMYTESNKLHVCVQHIDAWTFEKKNISSVVRNGGVHVYTLFSERSYKL